MFNSFELFSLGAPEKREKAREDKFQNMAWIYI